MGEFFDYPFQFDERGRAGTTAVDDHVRDMIFQLLFTNPGERVNLPDFGCGLQRLIFTPNSEMQAASTRFLVHGALQRWLGDVIQIADVQVTAQDARLLVEISYTRLDTGERRSDRFVSPSSGG